MAETILVLGGGIGGVAAANALRKRLLRAHRIIVVDREASFTLAASFLWVMTGARAPERVSRPLDRLRRKGIEVERGLVERIAPGEREVIVSGTALRGDRMIVALAAAPAYKCPAAPYEAAMLIDADCKRRGVRGAVQLSLFSAEPGPMGV